MKTTVEKLQELATDFDKLTNFEAGFVKDNLVRVEKYADETRFSEKQTALIDKIFEERVVENKPKKG